MNNLWKIGTITLIVIILVCLGIFIGKKIGETDTGGTIAENIPLISKNKGLSDKNRESARKAIDAIGEINSVASVGANYQQYTSAVQSARIKFDAAMRDYKPDNDFEEDLLIQFENTFLCYVDAKDAWTEFLQDGDAYNFLLPNKYSKIHDFSKKYGFTRSSNGEFYRDTVLSSILSKAAKDFHAVKEKVK